eukprot:6065913-Pyramimonas_sp.AAC.1
MSAFRLRRAPSRGDDSKCALRSDRIGPSCADEPNGVKQRMSINAWMSARIACFGARRASQSAVQRDKWGLSYDRPVCHMTDPSVI